MHIGKNVVETLWRIIDGRSEKVKIVKICNDIQEANHAMKDVVQFHRNEDQININSLPWMLTEQQSIVVKQVMQKIKFPIGFCLNMKNIITKKDDFVGVKMHDWNLFTKVIIIFMSIYNFFSFYCINLFSCLYTLCLENDVICILIQYVLPLSLPDNFDHNVKQVICNLGKYMR